MPQRAKTQGRPVHSVHSVPTSTAYAKRRGPVSSRMAASPMSKTASQAGPGTVHARGVTRYFWARRMRRISTEVDVSVLIPTTAPSSSAGPRSEKRKTLMAGPSVAMP